jgi:hypothetical protein
MDFVVPLMTLPSSDKVNSMVPSCSHPAGMASILYMIKALHVGSLDFPLCKPEDFSLLQAAVSDCFDGIVFDIK